MRFAGRIILLGIAVGMVLVLGLLFFSALHPPTSLALDLDRILAGIEQYDCLFNSRTNCLIKVRHSRELKATPPGYIKKFLPRTITYALMGQSIFAKIEYPESTQTYAWHGGRSVYVGDKAIFGKDQKVVVLGKESREDAEIDPYLYSAIPYVHEGLLLNLLSRRGVKLPALVTEELEPPFRRGKGQFTLRPAVEDVDGAPCYVVESAGGDVCWVDPEHGFLVRQLRRYARPGLLAVEIKNEGLFREELSGLWFPCKQVAYRYNSEEENPPEILGKLRAIETNVILEISFRELPNDLFIVPMPKTDKDRETATGRGS